MADHQLNEKEAVPTEEVEKLPEAIIIPVRVTDIQNLTAQNQKILFSREQPQAVFWVGAVRSVGDVRGSFGRGDIMLRVWRCGERWSGGRVRVQIYSCFRLFLFKTASWHCWTFFFHF